MANKNKDSRSRPHDNDSRMSGGNNIAKDQSRRGDKKLPIENTPLFICALCGKQIFDISSALTERDGTMPVHFDCALAQISKAEQLSATEKVVYIGKGGFAIIDSSASSFTIKRRIQWEKEGEKPEWRVNIQTKASN